MSKVQLRRNIFEGDYPLTQSFGENPDWYKKFGLRGHNGVDYATPTGTPLYSAIDGKVTEVYTDTPGYGKYIKIENDECGVLYAHMRVLSPLPVGSFVSAGEYIGPSGNTGNSTGPHLHFAVFTKPRDRTNGYNGYVDPFDDTVFEWVNEIGEPDDKDCQDELIEMRASRDKWKIAYNEDAEKHAKEIGEKIKTIEAQQKQVSTLNESLTLALKDKEHLIGEKSSLELALELQKGISEVLKDKLDAALDMHEKEYNRVREKLQKSQENLGACETKRKKKLAGASRWELFKAFFIGR